MSPDRLTERALGDAQMSKPPCATCGHDHAVHVQGVEGGVCAECDCWGYEAEPNVDLSSTLDQFWRCVHGCIGVAMGPPAKITTPPRCAHGEMEQTTAEGFTSITAQPEDADA